MKVDRTIENPGPGAYNPNVAQKTNAKTFNSGPDDKAKETKDNGVPGPGTYPAEEEPGLMKDETLQNAGPKWSFGKGVPALDKKQQDGKSVPGAGTYNVTYPAHTSKGVVFGNSSKTGKGAANEVLWMETGNPDNPRQATKQKFLVDARNRRKEQGKEELPVPGPMYDIPGDFDFPDPLNPDKTKGTKKAKFCFGMNTKTRAKNLDMPGPGEYEVDQYPMNQANIAYWIGTDVRRDLSVPNAYIYPGPGSYEASDTMVKQPAVS